MTKYETGQMIFEVSSFAARGARDLVNIIIVTATDVERDALRARLRPLSGTAGLARVRTPTQTFYLGVLGSYTVAHVECTMGSSGISSSQNAVNDAIAFWSPRLVIMPGIAFGADPKKQKLEDILLANAVVSYEPARKGVLGITRRGSEIPGGPTILDRLRDERGGRTAGPACHVGLLLSGEKLVDDPEFKAELLRDYPTAIGGEMEGAGVASACHRHHIEWALVKAICDWGDGTKNKKHQAAAAANAVSFVEQALQGAELMPNIAQASGAMRILTGTRCAFVHDPGDVNDFARLFVDARAPALFGSENSALLLHAAREVARNAFEHGGAQSASVAIGEREIVIRDDGTAFDSRTLASRLRSAGRDAGSLVLKTLVEDEASTFSIDYLRDDGADQNVLTIRLIGNPGCVTSVTCTIPPLDYKFDEGAAAALIEAARECSEIFYDARYNPDLSSQWRIIRCLLSHIAKDQLLVVTNCTDRLSIALHMERGLSQLVIR